MQNEAGDFSNVESKGSVDLLAVVVFTIAIKFFTQSWTIQRYYTKFTHGHWMGREEGEKMLTV